MIVCFLHMQVKSFLEKIKNTYKPFNYNFKNRPMHQDIKESYVENGAFYIFKKISFLKNKNRLSGKNRNLCYERRRFY